MRNAKWFGLALLTGSTVLALGGCAGGNWLPWAIGAGAVAWFAQQSA